MNLNIDNSRSYKTEANLVKALAAMGVDDTWRKIVVCNREGRFTAIFPLGANSPCDQGIINICGMAHRGFMVVG